MPTVKVKTSSGWQTLSSMPAAPSLVSVLPSSPYDGQEVYFQTTAMATAGIVWHLRYRAAASGSYKWEFLGGPPLAHEIVTSEVLQANSSAAFGDAVTVGPLVAVPLAGEFDYVFGGKFHGDNGGAAFNIGIQLGSAVADGTTSSGADSSLVGNWTFSLTNAIRRTRAQAETATVKYYRAGITNPAVMNRWLRVTPVRVG